MRLYIDDLRRCPDGWELARMNTEAIRILATGFVTEVSIDHDIIACPKPCCGLRMGQETFQPVAFYIACMPEELRPQKINFHTANEPAAIRMMGILKDVGIESEYRESTQPFYFDEKSK